MGDQVAGLQQDADAAGTELGAFDLRAVADALAADPDCAAGGLIEPGEAREEGGLTGPRWTDHSDGLTAIDGDAHPTQGQGLLLAGPKEPVQILRPKGCAIRQHLRDHAGHPDHRTESVTIFQGSTLSAPFGPDRVTTTSVPARQKEYRSKASCTTLFVTGSGALSPT